MNLKKNIKQFRLTLLIPLLIIISYICMVQYSEHLSKQEKEVNLRIHKEEIWVENIKKILISDTEREKIKDCFRCSLVGGHLSSDGSICIVESRCGCEGAAFCDCQGAMRFAVEEIQGWRPDAFHLEKLKKENIDRCFR